MNGNVWWWMIIPVFGWIAAPCGYFSNDYIYLYDDKGKMVKYAQYADIEKFEKSLNIINGGKFHAEWDNKHIDLSGDFITICSPEAIKKNKLLFSFTSEKFQVPLVVFESLSNQVVDVTWK